MTRRKLEKHLKNHGCAFHHHGANHDFYYNTKTLKKSPIPRHNEIK